MTRYAAITALVFLFSPVLRSRGEENIPAQWLGRHWFGIYVMEKKSGHGYTDLERNADGLRLSALLHYRISFPGGEQTLEMRTVQEFDAAGTMTRFRREIDSVLSRTRLSGAWTGDGFRIEGDGAPRDAPSARVTFRDCYGDYFLVRDRAPAGTEETGWDFDLTLLKPLRYRRRVEAIETAAGRGPGAGPDFVLSTAYPEINVSSQTRIDGSYFLIENRVGNLVLKEESETEARRANDPGDIVSLSSIEPSSPPPDPGGLASLSLRISGLPPGYALPSSPRQEAFAEPGGTCRIVTRREAAPKPRNPLPAGFSRFLAATPEFQAQDPSIAAAAEAAAGESGDALAAAGDICLWVHRSLKKNFMVALPDAVSVLKAGEGDCKAHATLFIALARAAGIPARMVTGLVCLSDGRFYYHQWAEVWAGDWYSLDPVLGQIGVDPGHIALARGPLDRSCVLAEMIGNLAIEVTGWETRGEPGGTAP
ncbi:MAG TPA: transglutaminase domain-containing protein [bacterium]|nr:transglutaminase domain-containing protein [bacterium]